MKALFPFFAVTDDIVVRVAVSFLPEQSQPEQDRWFWAYHVRIENEGVQAVQLLTRHWVITDGRGKVQEVRGDGVVGEQPWLQPGEKYEYTSGCQLDTPVGIMHGSYQMMAEDGTTFEAEIPAFTLTIPRVLH